MAYKPSKPNNKPPKKHLKKVLVVLFIVLLGVGGYFGYRYFVQNKNQSQKTTENINYNPPTEQEQQAGDSQKQNITEGQDRFKDQPSSQNQNNGTSNQATVVITDAGQYDDVVEVRAFVSNHYQDGQCTFTLTKNNLVVKKTTTAFRDVSTTICTNPLFNRNEFAQAGDWQIVVTYTADNVSGTSKPQPITIN